MTRAVVRGAERVALRIAPRFVGGVAGEPSRVRAIASSPSTEPMKEQEPVLGAISYFRRGIGNGNEPFSFDAEVARARARGAGDA